MVPGPEHHGSGFDHSVFSRNRQRCWTATQPGRSCWPSWSRLGSSGCCPRNISADYIIIDPPYCGLVNSQYSDLPSDSANMDQHRWTKAMGSIANRLKDNQPQGGRCTAIVPNSRTISTGERTLFPEIVRRLFQQADYHLYDVVYSSRRTQQRQSRQMGILNYRARRARVPMADISEVLNFINNDDPSCISGSASLATH